MKETIKKHLKHFRAEQIAEITLLRSGLFNVEKGAKNDFDFIIADKDKPEKIIAVEVKEMINTKSEIQKALQTLSKKYKGSEIPILAFFIDATNEKGVFTFLTPPKFEMTNIRADLFKKRMKTFLNKHLPMEYPPYKFFQKSDDCKYETGNIYVDEKFRALRLKNIYLSPMTEKENLALEIDISSSHNMAPYNKELASLTQGNAPNFLFFMNGSIQHIDIPLPPGRRILNIRVIPSPNIQDFEMRLTCLYI